MARLRPDPPAPPTVEQVDAAAEAHRLLAWWSLRAVEDVPLSVAEIDDHDTLRRLLRESGVNRRPYYVAVMAMSGEVEGSLRERQWARAGVERRRHGRRG